MPGRLRVSTISLLLVACAPSVPRPAEKPRVPDAAPDLSPTSGGAGGGASGGASGGAPTERADSRPGSGAATDARADVPGEVRSDARDAIEASDATRTDVGDASTDRPPDLPPQAPFDVQPDRRIEGDAPIGVDAGVDARLEALTDDAPAAVLPRAGDVVIDELLVNPAGTDTNREWIEMVNTTALALDLRLLHIADAANEVALDAGVLAPGAILVVGQSLDPMRNGGGPVDLSFGNSISLNNPGDSITLCLGSCADGLVLDQVSWTSDLGAAYDGRAVIVDPVSGAFCPADQPFGTAGSFGSPGATNPPCGI